MPSQGNDMCKSGACYQIQIMAHIWQDMSLVAGRIASSFEAGYAHQDSMRMGMAVTEQLLSQPPVRSLAQSWPAACFDSS